MNFNDLHNDDTYPGEVETTHTAAMARNQGIGMGDYALPGFNVFYTRTDGLQDTLIVRLPETWAAKAVRLLNACGTKEAQRAEMLRIRAALEVA